MSTIRIVRKLWLLGNAGLLAALVLPPPAHIIVMGAADVVLAVAWVMAIRRACKSRGWGWAFAIAVWPLAMWVYIFWRHAEVQRPRLGEQPLSVGLPPAEGQEIRRSRRAGGVGQRLETG